MAIQLVWPSSTGDTTLGPDFASLRPDPIPLAAGTEVKVVYNIALGVKRQLFQVEVFMFFPAELGSVDQGFYHSLWQVVRLHTPQVCSLRPSAPGDLLRDPRCLLL